MKLIKVNSLTTISMILTTLIGLIAFLWPFLLQQESTFSNNSDNAAILILLILPLVLMVALADVMQGGIDSRTLAILGVLIAVVSAVRPLGGHVAGL